MRTATSSGGVMCMGPLGIKRGFRDDLSIEWSLTRGWYKSSLSPGGMIWGGVGAGVASLLYLLSVK